MNPVPEVVAGRPIHAGARGAAARGRLSFRQASRMVIRQFPGEVGWEPHDVLVVDLTPGTGDEWSRWRRAGGRVEDEH